MANESRLIALAAYGHQHEIELRGDDGSTTPLVAKTDPHTGKVELFDRIIEEEIRDLTN